MRQLQAFAAFLDELYRLGGWTTDAEWSRASGVHAVNLSEARTGKSQLDGFNLLRLIRASAERAELEPAFLAALAARLEAAAGDPSAEILRRLDEVSGLVAEGFARLGADVSGEAAKPSAAKPQGRARVKD